MAIKNPPLLKTDPPIVRGDSGVAVKKIQDFLSSLSYVQESIKYLKDFGKEIDIKSAERYGIFEQETSNFVLEWQARNEKKIRTNFNISDQQWQREKGIVSYITWLAMGLDVGLKDSSVLSLPQEQQKIEISEPKKDKDSTHYVKTNDKNSRLALRDSPSFESVSKNSWEDTKKKGNLIKMLPNGTKLKIINPNIGYNCEWHEVIVKEDSKEYEEINKIQQDSKKRLYVFAEFIQAFKDTKPLLPTVCEDDCNFATLEEFKIPVGWQERDNCEPFLDQCYYCLTVTLEDEFTNESIFVKQKSVAIEQGVKFLLEYYNKQRDEVALSYLLGAYQFAMIPKDGWSLGTRPGSKLKFLVVISARFFNAVAEQTENFQDIPTKENASPSGWRTLTFKVKEHAEKIEQVERILDEKIIEIEEWNGTIENFDLSECRENITKFKKVFSDFVILNERSLEEDYYTIGFEGPCFNLSYVLSGDEKVSIPMRKGVNCLKKTLPFSSTESMSLIFYCDEIIKQNEEQTINWTDFLNSYICPIPKISPSDELEEKLKEESIVERKILKTETEKLREDSILSSATLKNEILEQNEKRYDYVGDNLLSCENIPKILDNISSIESLYDNVLGKISIGSISSQILPCIAKQISVANFNSIMCDMALEKMSYEEILSKMDKFSFETRNKVQENVTLNNEQKNRDEKTSKQILIQSLKLAASGDEICSTFSVPSSFEELSKFSVKVPTIKIPDNLFTEDIMSSISKNIEDSIKQSLSKILMEVVKIALKEICKDNCDFDEQDIGKVNINDAVSDKAKNDSLNKNSDLDETDLSNILNDLSNFLTPSEICELLFGTPRQELLKIIQEFIVKKYSKNLQIFSSLTKIKLFFAELGKKSDRELCFSTISKLPSLEDICEEKVEIFRKNLLSGKMSERQVVEQIKLLEEQNADKIKNLLRISDNQFLDELIKNVLPELCSQNFGEQDSSSVMIERMSNTIFDGVKNVFETDLSGFLISLLDSQNKNSIETSIEEYKKSHDARLKKIDEISKEDSAAMMKDPLAVGEFRKDSEEEILESFQEQIQNKLNFINPLNKNSQFAIFAAKSSIKPLGEELLEAAFEKIKELSEKLRDKQTLSEDFLKNIQSVMSIEEKEKECELSSEEIVKKLLNLEEIPVRNSLIQMFIKRDNNTDTISLIVDNDKKDMKYKRKRDENDFAQLKIDSLKFSHSQNLFANLIVESLSKVIDENSRKFLKEQQGFYNFLCTVAYNGLSQSMLHNINKRVSGSDFFKMSVIENLSFITDSEVQKNVLDVNELKSRSKKNIENMQKRCIQNTIEQELEQNTIEILLRVYTLEILIDGIFFFSVYNLKDVFQTSFMMQFFKERIIKDLKLEGEQYYQVILKRSQELVMNNMNYVSNILGEDINSEKSKQEHISQEQALEYLIQKNVLEVYELFSTSLETTQQTIYEQIINFMTLIDVPDDENSKRLVQMFPGEEIPIPLFGTIKNENPHYIFSNFSTLDEGTFALEKYYRVIREEEKEANYVQSSKNFRYFSNLDDVSGGPRSKCGKFGLRLSYIPPFSERNRVLDIIEQLDFIDKTCSKELSYLLEENDFFIPAKMKVVVIPLISVEDDQIIESIIGNEIEYDEDIKLEELKQKMSKMKQFKLLFENAISVNDFLSMSAIYNMNLLQKMVPDIENSFLPTKNYLKMMLRMTKESTQPWWNKKDSEVDIGNVEILKERNLCSSTGGSFNAVSSIAKMTIPLMTKGLAEKYDPSYKLIKSLFNAGQASLNWGDIIKVAPVNIFGPFGFGPPIGPYGMAALSLPKLPGEKNRGKCKK